MNLFVKVFMSAVFVAMGASTVWAMPNATYVCKMKYGPDHVYKFTQVQLANSGASVTHVETKRYLERNEGTEIVFDEIQSSGIGTTFKRADGSVTVVLAGMTFEFVDGALRNCQKQ